MPKKPTYEELEISNAKLERQYTELKQKKRALQEIENTFITLINLSPDPMVIIQDSHHLMVNSAWTKVFGYSQRDVNKGLGFYEFIQEKDREAVRERYHARMSGKKVPKSYEIELKTKGGKIKSFETTSTLIQIQDRPADLVIFRDISRQIQTEKAVKERDENFKALADNANDGIMVAVGDGVIVYANKRIAKMLHYTVKQLLKKRIKDLVHPNEYPKIAEHYRKTLQGVSPKTAYKSIAVRRDGKYVPVEISGGKTTWKGRYADITVVRDITVSKKVEKELKKKERELESKNLRFRELNDALNVLLDKRERDRKEHEEKILFNIQELILPYVAELKKKGSKGRKNTFAEIIQRNLEAIISSDFSGVSAKYLNLTPTEIKIAELVKQGHKTKTIAELLGSSPHTISNHKKSIRRKLDLTDKKANLRTHLISVS